MKGLFIAIVLNYFCKKDNPFGESLTLFSKYCKSDLLSLFIRVTERKLTFDTFAVFSVIVEVNAQWLKTYNGFRIAGLQYG